MKDTLSLPFFWYEDRWTKTLDRSLREVFTASAALGYRKAIRALLIPVPNLLEMTPLQALIYIQEEAGSETFMLWHHLGNDIQKAIALPMMHILSTEMSTLRRIVDISDGYGYGDSDTTSRPGSFQQKMSLGSLDAEAGKDEELYIFPGGLLLINKAAVWELRKEKPPEEITQQDLQDVMLFAALPPREPGNHARLATYETLSRTVSFITDRVLDILPFDIATPDFTRMPDHVPFRPNDD